MKAQFTKSSLKQRLARLVKAQKEMLAKVDDLHVKLQNGNSKTGKTCYTVSLLPVLDCKNCKECKWNCYDLKSDMIYENTINDRARNSAIHKVDPKRFWDEVNIQVKANFITLLRINVGGDLNDDDFAYVAELGRDNPKVNILFFTKNYDGINTFLERNEFPENVHPIMSAWKGVEMDNPYNLPESHVLYPNGETTAPAYGAYFCGGNCTECAFKEEGCWNLKRNEHVIFKAH